MKLADLGEFGLIHRIRPQFPAPPGALLGIGDDCAVLPAGDDRVELVTTDLLIEDVHFLRQRITPGELGHKALAVNLSDIAAMGGTPTAAFLSIGLPGSIEVEWIDRFFAGLKSLSVATGCPLLGGDTTKSKNGIVINIAVLGSAKTNSVKFRSTAKPGDVVAVTGFLGDSGTGLRLLLQDLPIDDEDRKYLITAHHCPAPHLTEGQWLARHQEVHAMMDVSDGIDSDLQRIIELSNVGVVINAETLPISDPMRRVCDAMNWPAGEIAATGGEDYCLLCTVEAGRFGSLANAFLGAFGRPLTAIGIITDGGGLVYQREGKPMHWTRHGFDHFKS